MEPTSNTAQTSSSLTRAAGSERPSPDNTSYAQVMASSLNTGSLRSETVVNNDKEEEEQEGSDAANKQRDHGNMPQTPLINRNNNKNSSSSSNNNNKAFAQAEKAMSEHQQLLLEKGVVAGLDGSRRSHNSGNSNTTIRKTTQDQSSFKRPNHRTASEIQNRYLLDQQQLLADKGMLVTTPGKNNDGLFESSSSALHHKKANNTAQSHSSSANLNQVFNDQQQLLAEKGVVRMGPSRASSGQQPLSSHGKLQDQLSEQQQLLKEKGVAVKSITGGGSSQNSKARSGGTTLTEEKMLLMKQEAMIRSQPLMMSSQHSQLPSQVTTTTTTNNSNFGKEIKVDNPTSSDAVSAASTNVLENLIDKGIVPVAPDDTSRTTRTSTTTFSEEQLARASLQANHLQQELLQKKGLVSPPSSVPLALQVRNNGNDHLLAEDGTTLSSGNISNSHLEDTAFRVPGSEISGIPGAHAIATDRNSTDNNDDDNNNNDRSRDGHDEGGDPEAAIQPEGLAVANLVLEDNPSGIPQADPMATDATKKSQKNCQHNYHQARIYVAILIVFLVVILVGSICGSGNCQSGSSDSTADGQQTNASSAGIMTERETRLYYWIDGINGPAYFNVSSSGQIYDTTMYEPRKKALQWMANEDPLMLDPLQDPSRFLQRYTLAHFFLHTTQNQPWRVCNPPTKEERDRCFYTSDETNLDGTPGTRWLTQEDECYWAGVVCSNRDFASKAVVTSLKLLSNQINGNIPTEIAALTHLETLNFYNNSMTGTIPFKLAGLTQLTTLNMIKNHLSGSLPPFLFQMPHLQTIALDYNQFTSSIPAEVQDFRGTELRLASNSLKGSLPVELFFASNITFLDLSNNMLTSSIPTEIGQTTQLSYVSLSSNFFEGSLPNEISNLGMLREIIVNSNAGMSGSIPEALYAGNTNLAGLFLQDCSFSGTISSWVGHLSKLNALDVSNNPGIHGTLPSEIANIPKLSIVKLHGTNMTGTIGEEICASKFVFDNHLEVVADCLKDSTTGDVPMVCPQGCCTKCCDRTTGLCKEM